MYSLITSDPLHILYLGISNLIFIVFDLFCVCNVTHRRGLGVNGGKTIMHLQVCIPLA